MTPTPSADANGHHPTRRTSKPERNSRHQSRSSPDMEVISTENRWRDGNDSSAGGQLQKKVKKTSARLVKKAKRRKRELKLEAAAEISQAKSKLKSNFRSPGWWYSVLKLALVVLAYFSSSVALTFYQKDLISALPFPLVIVTCHLVIKFILAGICRSAISYCCPSVSPVPTGQSAASQRRNRRHESSEGNQRTLLGWHDYISKVAPVGVASSWDIGLSQWSLKFVTVALYTMTKTTSILFIMILGIAFKLERKHWSQVLIVVSISVGIGLFTHKATSFSTVGFAMCLTASLMCGFRWTLCQKVMQKSEMGLENPIDMIYHVQPIMIMAILPLAVGMEGLPFAASIAGFRYHSFGELARTVAEISGGGILAFFMEVFEYLIITIGSSLTLAIIGVSKEIVTVSVSLARNHTRLSPLNSVGMVVCLAGIVAHVGRKAVMHNNSNASTGDNPTSGQPSNSSTRNRSGPNTFEMGDFGLSESSDSEGAGTSLTNQQGGSLTSKQNSSYTSVPLLDSDWSTSSEEDEVVANNRPKNNKGPKKDSGWKAPDDNFFLSDNRTWTSVKDNHLKQLSNEAESQQKLPKDGTEKSSKNKVKTAAIITPLSSD